MPLGARVYLRLAVAIAALACGAVAAVVVAHLLRTTPGPTSAVSGTLAAPPAPAPAPPAPAGGFPAPPPGSVVLARESGRNAVALALRQGEGALRLQASVVGPAGEGVSGLDVGFATAGRSAPAASCGPGCYDATLRVRAPGRSVAVLLAGTPVSFALPARWAPRDATAIVARAGRVWRSLRTLVSHERLAAGPGDALRTVYRFEAPSSLSYTIAGRSAAVVIGADRWDRSAPDSPWRRSKQLPELRQPTPFWASARDAHVLETASLRGRPVWRVTFFDPRSSAWFDVAIDRRSYRTLDIRMIAASHFMHDVYGPFDADFHIEPPVD